MTEDHKIPDVMEDEVVNDCPISLYSFLLQEQAFRLHYLVVDLNEQWDVLPHTSHN